MSSWHREYLVALENRDMHEKAHADIFNACNRFLADPDGFFQLMKGYG